MSCPSLDTGLDYLKSLLNLPSLEEFNHFWTWKLRLVLAYLEHFFTKTYFFHPSTLKSISRSKLIVLSNLLNFVVSQTFLPLDFQRAFPLLSSRPQGAINHYFHYFYLFNLWYLWYLWYLYDHDHFHLQSTTLVHLLLFWSNFDD